MEKLKVLVDMGELHFSEMLVSALGNIGIETDRLCRPDRSFQLDNFRRFAMWGAKLLTSRAQIVHYIGGDFPLPFYAIPRLLGKKVVVHWIGTDSLKASTRKLSWTDRLSFRLINLHLAQAPHLAAELDTIGINAKVIPLVPNEPVPDPILLGTDVCIYLPEDKLFTYNANATFQLIQEMPDVNFLVLANSGKQAPAFPNVSYFNWMTRQKMESIWMRTKVLLRLTLHDGMPVTIIEALLRGRYVIWTYAFPFCSQVNSNHEAKIAIRAVLAQTELNTKGQEYAQVAFAPTKMAEKIKQEYANISTSVGIDWERGES